jgi:hypothetical protein
MRRLAAVVLTMVALLMAVGTLPADADSRRHHHHPRPHAATHVFIGGGFGPAWRYDPFWAPAYVYTPPPVVVEGPPMVYIERQPSYWYYCQDPQGYYPSVEQCPGGWVQVAPQPAAPTQ